MLEWLWGGLGPAERVVASALAEAGRRPITQEELERILLESGVRVIIRELQNAPELLQEWDILEPADSGFRFRVELLRRWLVDHKPLTRVQEELDHVEPVAESFYQAGLGLYRSGRLEAAIQPLQQAMNINPNHIRATELLADIYLAQGQPDEAREILDRLYDYHPAAARPRLIQALLSEARRIEAEEERLPLYEQILAMHPGQREAQANVRRIWRRRGDAAQAAGKLEEALAAYEQAGLTQEAAHIREKLQAQQAHRLAQQMQAFEAQEAYDEALEIAQQLRTDYVGDWVTESDVERLVRRAQIKALYQRAKRSRDMKTAKDLLVEVLTIDPMYKDTAHLLNEVVTALKASQQEAAASVTSSLSTSATEPPLTSPPPDATNSPPSQRGLVKHLRTPWLIVISTGIAFVIPTLSWAMGILPPADFPGALIFSLIVSLVGMMTVSTSRKIEGQPQKRANWISTSLLLLLLLASAFLFWFSFLDGWRIL
jgi:tetratricopeptide (TPR) repeat protein